MKKLLIYLVAIFCFLPLTSVYASECSNEEIKVLKQKAEAIQIDTEFNYDALNNYLVYDNYIIYVSGLSEDLYVMTSDLSIGFFFENVENGVVSRNVSNSIEYLNVYSTECSEVVLRKIKLNLKKYNPFSTYPECLEIDDSDLNACKQFLDDSITYEEFMQQIENYNSIFLDTSEEKNIWNYIKKYYYLIIIFGVIIFGVIILIFKRRKKRYSLD